MHVHLALAWAYARVKEFFDINSFGLPSNFLQDKDQRYYENLAEFHKTYEGVREASWDDFSLQDVVYEYLVGIAAEGAVCAEISNSFRDPESFRGQIQAVNEGIEKARKETGIEVRIIATSLRNSGADHALKLAQYLAAHTDDGDFRYVAAFGLVGDETVDSLAEYEPAMQVAWNDAGLGVAPHGGEQDVRNLVDFLDIVPRLWSREF